MPDVAPDLLEILAGFSWHRDAACRDEPDERTFFPDEPKDLAEQAARMGSAALLLPLLICERCPVRRACLTDALRSVPFMRNEDRTDRKVPVSDIGVEGVWGGTLAMDRHATEDMPAAEALELLERTFAVRLSARLTAWRAQTPANRSSRWRKRIAGLLEARRVTAASPRPAACERCGGRLPWRKRADARWCSAACKQALYRARAAA